MRFNREQGRLDGHCGHHGQQCKMDRRLRKGTVGLVLAWVAASGDGDRAHHVELKSSLSSAAGFERRAARRAAFQAAAVDDAEVRAILEAEEAERGGDDLGPPSIQCPANFQELARALSSQVGAAEPAS